MLRSPLIGSCAALSRVVHRGARYLPAEAACARRALMPMPRARLAYSLRMSRIGRTSSAVIGQGGPLPLAPRAAPARALRRWPARMTCPGSLLSYMPSTKPPGTRAIPQLVGARQPVLAATWRRSPVAPHRRGRRAAARGPANRSRRTSMRPLRRRRCSRRCCRSESKSCSCGP